jgi:hypothetical protein
VQVLGTIGEKTRAPAEIRRAALSYSPANAVMADAITARIDAGKQTLHETHMRVSLARGYS